MKSRHGCVFAVAVLVVGAMVVAHQYSALTSSGLGVLHVHITTPPIDVMPLSGQPGSQPGLQPGLLPDARLQNAQLHAHIAGALPYPVRDETGTLPYEPFYQHIQCVTEKSENPCSFPLLTDYFKRCGYFAETTTWRNSTEGYPVASMRADICQVPPVTSGAAHLQDYIRTRNITSVVLIGDSQGHRYYEALVKLFQTASFQCKKLKQERAGKHMSLDYYTKGSGFKTSTVVKRMCESCVSTLHVCSDTGSHKISVEYISMDMGSRIPIHLTGAECKQNPRHPLCMNLTQQEYVFKYYLNRSIVYPELLLIFSVNAHRIFRPLQEGFDAIRYKWKTVTDNVPASSSIIWYDAPLFHVKNNKREPTPPEGHGLPANDKMQILNHFLATVLTNHHKAGKRPTIYTFFDLYHMQERLKEIWKHDDVHSKPVWYDYVIGYTAAMLPSLP